MSQALSDAFRYSKLVLATTTYNAGIYPFMNDFITRLAEHNFQNRTVGLIENGSWAPLAAKVMKNMLSECKEDQLAGHHSEDYVRSKSGKQRSDGSDGFRAL